MDSDPVNFPCMILSTIPCECDTVKYRVVVCFDEHNNSEALIDSVNLLPFLGKTVELLNAHRVEQNKNQEKINSDDEQ